jgi:cell division protein FtsL
VQALYISDASSIGKVFFTGTINIILITFTVLSIVLVVWTQMKGRAMERQEEQVSASAADQLATADKTE